MQHARSLLVASFVGIAVTGAAACSREDKVETTTDTQATGQMASAEQFTATLDGAAERPNPVTTSATGTARLSFTGSGPITYSVDVTGLTTAATAVHIHGPADSDGSVGKLVTLMPLASATTGALASGSITQADDAMITLDSLKTLLRNGMAYVNVHTTTYPDGEIRGQVKK